MISSSENKAKTDKLQLHHNVTLFNIFQNPKLRVYESNESNQDYKDRWWLDPISKSQDSVSTTLNLFLSPPHITPSKPSSFMSVCIKEMR